MKLNDQLNILDKSLSVDIKEYSIFNVILSNCFILYPDVREAAIIGG